jgi:hypothetical protein
MSYAGETETQHPSNYSRPSKTAPCNVANFELQTSPLSLILYPYYNTKYVNDGNPLMINWQSEYHSRDSRLTKALFPASTRSFATTNETPVFPFSGTPAPPQ